MTAPKIEPQPIENPPKIVKTCRWSNCGESCPSGSKNVMRDGTSETMVDGTGCPGSSPHQWCCPADFELPTCTWRGFRNSGACRPGCNEGEAEVGTLSVGCSSKHQSACCTTNAATKAYSMCQWFGESSLCSGSGGYKACEGDWPHRIVSASQGAGGEQPCGRGAKSYCCKEIPDQFTDCAWYKKETSTVVNTLFCETSCPKDSIRLSMQQGDCKVGGLQAYCCKGKAPEKLVPRDPNWGNNQYKELIELLQAWAKNPSCPSSIGVDGNDYYFDAPVKRSLERGEECTKSDFARLVTWIVTLLKYPTATPDTLKYGWDNVIASFDSTGDTLGYDNLAALVSENSWDANGLVSDVLLDPYMAQRNVYNFQMAQKQCTTSSKPATSRRDVQVANNNTANGELGARDLLDERRIFLGGGGGGPARDRNLPNTWRGQPDAATILDGIALRDLEFRYARWQREQGGTRMFLEVGYHLGPGRVHNGGVYDRYRDLTPNRIGTNGLQDEWVLVHIHIDHTNPNLFTQDAAGNVFIGTPSMRLFHGQQITQPNPNQDPRVDGTVVPPPNSPNGMRYANCRAPLHTCPTGVNPQPLYYLGINPIITGRTLTWTDILSNWARGLWENQILNSHGLSYVFFQNGKNIAGANDQFDLNVVAGNLPVPIVLPWQGQWQDDPTRTNFVWDPASSQYFYNQPL